MSIGHSRRNPWILEPKKETITITRMIDRSFGYRSHERTNERARARACISDACTSVRLAIIVATSLGTLDTVNSHLVTLCNARHTSFHLDIVQSTRLSSLRIDSRRGSPRGDPRRTPPTSRERDVTTASLRERVCNEWYKSDNISYVRITSNVRSRERRWDVYARSSLVQRVNREFLVVQDLFGIPFHSTTKLSLARHAAIFRSYGVRNRPRVKKEIWLD